MSKEAVSWQNLASEIIVEIFSHFLPGLTLPVYQPDFFPWYLGQICRSWRAVFISSPKFWCSFIIHPERNRHRHTAKYLIKLCLTRSVNEPLSFSYRSSWEDQDSMVLKLLVAHSARWQDAYLNLTKYTENSILYETKHRLAKLRSFKLTYSVENQYRDILEGAFQLKRLSIVDFSEWRLEWSSLTTVHLGSSWGIQPTMMVDALSSIDRLEELHISAFHTYWDLPLPQITLPFLRILGANTVSWFTMLITPNLEELHIRNNLNDVEDQTLDRSLALFFRQPLGFLRRIVFHPSSEADLAITFKNLPDVEEISLYVSTSSLMQCLPLCPAARHHLKTVVVGFTNYNTDKLSEILATADLWSMQSKAVGIGRFEALQRFTLELEGERKCTDVQFLSFEEEFVQIFRDRGVHCEVRDVGRVDYERFGSLEFEVFNDASIPAHL